jgi:hypothetical protein
MMVSRRAGHFVQVFKPIGPKWYSFTMPKPRNRRHASEHPNYARVEGRTIERTVNAYPPYAPDGWFYVSRELDLKRAKFYAKAYRRAGFKTRIVLMENSGKTTVVM